MAKYTQDMQDAIDKSWPVYRLMLFASALIILSLTGAFLGGAKWMEAASNASSFVGYSQSCWQIGDTLTVVTAKGDTLRLDISRLEGEQ